MIDKTQLRYLISRVLKDTGLYSESAVELLMLTAAVESRLGTYIRQVGGGPALGIFQMEPATHADIWDNYLEHKWDLHSVITPFLDGRANFDDQLEYNLAYAALMARVHYLRIPEPLPDRHDVEGLARYWKKYYNTRLGKGTVEKAVEAYYIYC